MDSFANRVEGDDKEVLNWAAIERLPTYERLKQGILDTCTVDVHHLSIQQKQSLVEKLVKVLDQHNQTFLAKLKNRIHSVRIELPTVEVRLEHLIVETKIYVGKELYLHSLTSQRMSLR
ncbi:pleiotropic drug resistance protein 1-like [Cannabis sativa]|uniref:pleiotropic drug resistance protein 1-like n=1 Tax=Cannabis sativa TaxID=3483 RepID=UPI0029CA05E8|nr:pleiotropic drug resistance protein 1-like [Cannabis sativa]